MSKKEQYDSIADTFIEAKHDFFETEKDLAREYILKNLTDGNGVILDIGCGAGEDVAAYEQMPFQKVIGIDPSIEMIERARKVVAHPENLYVAGYEKIPVPDNSIDCIVARFSLHYVQESDLAYQEMFRV